MTLADGRRSKGSYIAHCQKGECSAKEIRWHEVSPGNIEGELFKRGKVIYRYTRTLSDDGKTMTISFFDPNKPTDAPKARQVWGAAVNTATSASPRRTRTPPGLRERAGYASELPF
jgi:hypothetical protein